MPPTKMAVILFVSMTGGVTAARWGYEHLFVEGITDEERAFFGKLAASVAVVGAAYYLFDIDKRWFTIEGASKIAEERGYVPTIPKF